MTVVLSVYDWCGRSSRKRRNQVVREFICKTMRKQLTGVNGRKHFFNLSHTTIAIMVKS